MRWGWVAAGVALAVAGTARELPTGEAVDAEVRKLMARTQANGIAVAIVDDGRVRYLRGFGIRNARRDPLTTDTVMYGASLTKTVFAYTAMQLVDAGELKLDKPLGEYLDKPLPWYGPDPVHADRYGPYRDLANDPRWEKITARMCLTHATGFHNFWFLEPDQKLRIHFEPGSRYSYSGEGFILLQFAMEKGLKLDAGKLTQSVFDRLGMGRTSLVWRDAFASNLADGWDDKGKAQAHDERSKPRAAGSMDTTIADMAKFANALVRGEGLSPASRAEMTKPQIKITTAHQFPVLAAELPERQQRPDLYAGLGSVVFKGPQGPGFFKGGHDEQTANTMVCLEQGRRCVVVLSNDVRAEAGFAELVRFILGDTGVPFDWEYGDHAGKS